MRRFGVFVVVSVLGCLALGATPAVADPSALTSLIPALSFDKQSYHVGDVARLRITLINRSETDPINGIQAFCDRAQSGHEVTGIGDDWATLDGPGVDLAPGETKVLFVNQVVVAGAAALGQFDADCFFGPGAATGDVDGLPDGIAGAKALPSAKATVDLRLRFIDDSHGDAPVDSVVRLLDPATHSPIDVATLELGTSWFRQVPTGCYALGIKTDWHLAPGQTGMLDTAELVDGEWDVHVLPGTEQGPPTATSCTTTSSNPPAQPTTSTTSTTTAVPAALRADGGRPLPNTGVNVLGYAIPAMALIALGVVALVFTRRRGRSA